MESQIGKIYFSYCPDNKDYYRTIRILKNYLNGGLQSQISNPVYGNPPPDMPEIPPLMRSKLLSINNSMPYAK